MGDTYFSKLSPEEKQSRLIQLGQSKGKVTVWVKGQRNTQIFNISTFDKEKMGLSLDANEDSFSSGSSLLCNFELRGMFFFSQVLFVKNDLGQHVLEFSNELFKLEKRGSFRLLTFPIYNVFAEFDAGEAYEGGKVIDLKNRTSQTALFKNFLKLVQSSEETSLNPTIRYRIQDFSATGMCLHIGDLESPIFKKDYIFQDVKLQFPDEEILIPQVKVVYVIDYITGSKALKKYKVGLHFLNLSPSIDDQLGRKINELLREIEFNKDFENFTK